MDIAAILVAGALAPAQQTTGIAEQRREEYLAIAQRVAGAGKPDCTAYHPDDSVTACLPRFSIRHSRQINA